VPRAERSSSSTPSSRYGAAALEFAVVVKLVRTLMIIPVSVGLAFLQAAGGRSAAASRSWCSRW